MSRPTTTKLAKKVAEAPATKAKRTTPVLYIGKGSTVSHLGREYIVLNVLDLNRVLARDSESEDKVILDISSTKPPNRMGPPPEGPVGPDLESVTKEDWEVAEEKLKIIRPLMYARLTRTREDYRKAALAAGVSTATIYRWVRDYRYSETLSSLLPLRRTGGSGTSRLHPDVELIMQDYIKTNFLSLQKPSPAAAAKEIRRLCSNAKLSPLPAITTVYRRLEWLSEYEKLKRREGSKAAGERFDIHKNPIPDAEWALAVVMIDHTQLPIMIVDDDHRLPISRPWITLAIDVFSRVCLGMYIALDSPSAMSAGMCVAHAILPKETWMARLGFSDIKWNFYGRMDVLHMDNAREFRGNMLRMAAKEYDIDLHLRPVKKPKYGGHIERLMGTVSQGLKTVAGATFSGPKEKGVYDAEGNACMTIDEVEKWLVLFFARYHRDIHSGIGTTPLTKWSESILGTKTKPGRGNPGRYIDVEKMRIDFMPFEERTIQDYGVLIDKVHYFHDVLRPWVALQDPDHPKQKRKYRFRYDPRDISALYFFDPKLGRYFLIPYRDSSRPPVSIWELRAAKKQAIEMGLVDYDERVLFEFINRQRAIQDASAVKTKAARVARQKRSQHAKARQTKKADLPTVSDAGPTSPPLVLKGYDPTKVRSLDEDDE